MLSSIERWEAKIRESNARAKRGRERFEAKLQRYHAQLKRERERKERKAWIAHPGPQYQPTPRELEVAEMRYLGQEYSSDKDFWRAPIVGNRWIRTGSGRGKWIILCCRSPIDPKARRYGKHWRVFVQREHFTDYDYLTERDSTERDRQAAFDARGNAHLIQKTVEDLGLSVQKVWFQESGDAGPADYLGILRDGYPKGFGRVMYRVDNRDERNLWGFVLRFGIKADRDAFDAAKARWDEDHRCEGCGRPGIRFTSCRYRSCRSEQLQAEEREKQRRAELKRTRAELSGWYQNHALVAKARKALRGDVSTCD